jgi:hypothetical protein
MPWKYVIVRLGNDRELPVIFPESMVHSEMANALKAYYGNEAQFLANGQLTDDAVRVIHDSVVPVAAGHCEVRVLGAQGRSETLQLDSRPEDTDLINGHPYTHGILGALNPEDVVRDVVRDVAEGKTTPRKGIQALADSIKAGAINRCDKRAPSPHSFRCDKRKGHDGACSNSVVRRAW